MELRFGDVVVACSNVDRVVFPEPEATPAITKGELITYHRDVAPVMLPELRGRALTLERFTKGLPGGGFFQKHYQKHFPTWLASLEIPGHPGPRSKGASVVYPVANDAASLVYLANQGAIALHVGTSRAGSLGCPDLVVFDLDPPEGTRPAPGASRAAPHAPSARCSASSRSRRSSRRRARRASTWWSRPTGRRPTRRSLASASAPRRRSARATRIC